MPSLKSRIRKLKKNLRIRRKFPSSAIGSVNWMNGTELKYGGRRRVKQGRTSPFDPRSPGRCTGGDRMHDHGYARYYTQFLQPFIENRRKRFTVVEIGILNGTGLAIWCDLFPNSRVIGLDVELDHFKSNRENLENLGAFSEQAPEVHEFDQFVDNADYVKDILNGDRIDICIDDGHHSVHSILTTLDSVAPSLNDEFLYFVEDNEFAHEHIRDVFDGFHVYQCGELLTVLTRRDSATSKWL